MGIFTTFRLFPILLIICVVLISCKPDKPKKERSAGQEIYYFDKKFESINFTIPGRGETKKIHLNQIKDFCLRKDYVHKLILDYEFIRDQETFESIATASCDTIRQTPFIDFSKNGIVAIMIDYKVYDINANYTGQEIRYQLDSIYRTTQEITIKFNITRIDPDPNNVMNANIKSQMFLYQVPVDDSLKFVYVTSGALGEKMEVKSGLQ